MSTLVTPDPSKIRAGAGCLRYAPLGTAVPAMVAAGSTFSADTWDVAWLKIGTTTVGNTRATSLETEDFFVQEDGEPVFTATTSRATTVSFTMAEETMLTLKLANNGGTVATVSGTGATLSTSYAPPLFGAETPCMLSWESDDLKFRELYYSCLQTGTPGPQRAKGANPALYEVSFKLLKPDPAVSLVSWKRFGAGVGGAV